MKIALFDLDNTLIIGDIGEAVFAHLLADEAPLKCTWEEYQSFLRCDVSAACRLVVESMAGLTVREVEEATMKVLKKPASFIKAGNTLVPVPKMHREMKKLVSLLRKLRYNIYVISANKLNLRSNDGRRILCTFLPHVLLESKQRPRTGFSRLRLSNRFLLQPARQTYIINISTLFRLCSPQPTV